MKERFFILGCQRTGTTLLRLILESHPDVSCYDELRAYSVLRKSLIEDPPRERFIGFKIPRWTEQLTHGVLSDEGEDPCNHFYEGEKILFLLRNVHDTIASMLKLRIGGSSWCETWVPRIIKSKRARDRAFRSRYAAEWKTVEDTGRPLAGLAALYWKYKTEVFFDYQHQRLPVWPVPYERLVTAPRRTLEGVCRHLGMPFHENLLEHNRFQHTELFDSGLTVGDADPRKPIQSESVGYWQQYLASQDLEVIAQVCGDLPSKVASLADGGSWSSNTGPMRSAVNATL